MTTLRERKRQDTQDRLLASAVALFVERGYDATSMDDVAVRADVSRATAFNYFARKEALLVAWADRRRESVRAGLTTAPGDSVLGSLEGSLVGLAGWYVRDAAVTRPMIRCWLRAGGPLLPTAGDSAEVLAVAIRAGQRSGEIRTNIDASAAGRLLLNGFLGAVYQWASTDVPDRWLRKEVQSATRLVLTSWKA